MHLVFLVANATENKNQELDGSFGPTSRGFFELAVSPTEIQATSVSTNIASLYDGKVQSWISKSQAPFAFFYDIDDDPTTDNLLVADSDGDVWLTRLLCESSTFISLAENGFVDLDECVDTAPDGPVDPVALSEETIDAWIKSPLFGVGRIEDFGNVNLNYHIKVEDSFHSSSFTLRITPTADENDPTPSSTPWLDTLPWNSNLEIKKLRSLSSKTPPGQSVFNFETPAPTKLLRARSLSVSLTMMEMLVSARR